MSCCCDDGDVCEVWSPSWHRARKWHRCFEDAGVGHVTRDLEAP
jgi:hypothetical protein